MKTRLVGLLVLLTLLVACGSASAPTPAETPAPTSEPQPETVELWDGGPIIDLPAGFKVEEVIEFGQNCSIPVCEPEDSPKDCEGRCDVMYTVLFSGGCSIEVKLVGGQTWDKGLDYDFGTCDEFAFLGVVDQVYMHFVPSRRPQTSPPQPVGPLDGLRTGPMRPSCDYDPDFFDATVGDLHLACGVVEEGLWGTSTPEP